MSDVEKADANEQAFLSKVHQRKVIADALKNGTLSCLPGADGYADTGRAVNLVNGTNYHGANLLQLKEFQKQNGFPTAEYVTQASIEKSGIPIRKGQHGIELSLSTKNEDTGEWDHKTVKLFNVAQSVKPWELKKWAAGQVEERLQEKQDFLKSQFGANYQPEQFTKTAAPEIACTSTEPEKYLGQYLAAVSLGSPFKVTKEQAAEFSANFENTLFERSANGHTNPFKLTKICNAAGEHCKEVMRDIRKEQREPTQQRDVHQGQKL